MARLSLWFLFAAILASFLSVTCAPVEKMHVLEKRRSGRGTWFNVGLGACQKVNKDGDLIVALGKATYGHGQHCDMRVRITSGTHTATAIVRDLCSSCGPNDLDMSPSLFQHFASLGVGVISINWNFA